MKKIYPVNKEISLKNNIKDILPMMFDDFMALSYTIINFPMRKNDLHEMRKRGKPLRYTMELGEYCFTGEFKQYLDEIKDALELMGEIHDADVMIPEINLHIKEIRLFNQTLPDVKQRLSTRTMRDAAAHMRALRKEMYAKLCSKLNDWKNNDFKSKLIARMNE